LAVAIGAAEAFERGLPPMLIKAFRQFVSSTFADFLAERELLQDEVFPALDCLLRGQRLSVSSLDPIGCERRGASRPAYSEICFAEVQAAKGYPPPNFLIMIGNRYGWCHYPMPLRRMLRHAWRPRVRHRLHQS
jgi:hypothetical protein